MSYREGASHYGADRPSTISPSMATLALPAPNMARLADLDTRHHLGRVSLPEQIPRTVLQFAADELSLTTNSLLAIDGILDAM